MSEGLIIGVVCVEGLDGEQSVSRKSGCVSRKSVGVLAVARVLKALSC